MDGRRLRGVRFALRQRRLFMVVVSVLGVLFLVCAAVLLKGVIVDNEVLSLIGVALLGTLGVVFVWVPVRHLLTGRGNPRSITIAEDGVVIAMIGGTALLTWERIEDIAPRTHLAGSTTVEGIGFTVTPEEIPAGASNWRKSMAGLRAKNPPFVGHRELRHDPGVVLTALRFYWRNPEARDELDTDAAPRRIVTLPPI
ncbi:hypothetical protein EV193_11892 [Herbihabitans rhizosphaerae]|uniref:Uncharacterized protein n=1 Tax=Herbihabitans rhizosphaerae TaxID=1872711 RepID=A0A4Q7KBD7_9PSEU|nr:hypothetical protein EV193_11892 [Herbihabitans rhizosphaerae]